MDDSKNNDTTSTIITRTISRKIQKIREKIVHEGEDQTITGTITRTISRKIQKVKDSLYESTEMIKLPRLKEQRFVSDSQKPFVNMLKYRPSS